MGDEKTTQTTDSRAIATPEETELNKILLERQKKLDPQITSVQGQGLDLVGALLAGQPLPGYLGALPGGISPQVTSGIVEQSLEDIRPGLQQSGLFDSGVRAELEGQLAKDIRLQSEQFNLQNLLQLLNLGVGGQAQVQAPIQAGSSQLSGALAGLRQNVGTTTLKQMNPFLKSFEQSYGSNMGKGASAATFAAFM